MKARSLPSRAPTSTRTTWGMISPAFWITTVSPIRTSLRRISSALCRLARLTVVPASGTGVRSATGVSLPVLPTCTVIPTTLVTACSASYLKAINQRGLLLRVPSRACWPRSSTLMTSPSVWKSSVFRFSDHCLRILDDRVDRVEHRGVRADGDSPALDPLLELGVGAELDPFEDPQAVGDEPEPALGAEARIEELERARRGVSGVGERELLVRPPQLVQAHQLGVGHVDLAPHLQQPGRVAFECQGDAPDRLEVGRDVVAPFAVAPGRSQDEHPMLVTQRRGHAVDLELDDVADRLARREAAADAAVPLAELVEVVGVLDREHRNGVRDRPEFGQGRAADALGGAVGSGQLGMLGLERLETLHEAVVLPVADLRRRLDVVEAVVPVDLGPEAPRSLPWGPRPYSSWLDPLAFAGNHRSVAIARTPETNIRPISTAEHRRTVAVEPGGQRQRAGPGPAGAGMVEGALLDAGADQVGQRRHGEDRAHDQQDDVKRVRKQRLA